MQWHVGVWVTLQHADLHLLLIICHCWTYVMHLNRQFNFLMKGHLLQSLRNMKSPFSPNSAAISKTKHRNIADINAWVDIKNQFCLYCTLVKALFLTFWPVHFCNFSVIFNYGIIKIIIQITLTKSNVF